MSEVIDLGVCETLEDIFVRIVDNIWVDLNKINIHNKHVSTVGKYYQLQTHMTSTIFKLIVTEDFTQLDDFIPIFKQFIFDYTDFIEHYFSLVKFELKYKCELSNLPQHYSGFYYKWENTRPYLCVFELHLNQVEQVIDYELCDELYKEFFLNI